MREAGSEAGSLDESAVVELKKDMQRREPRSAQRRSSRLPFSTTATRRLLRPFTSSSELYSLSSGDPCSGSCAEGAWGPSWLTFSSPRAQMVYYKRWEEFASASGALYEAAPVKVSSPLLYSISQRAPKLTLGADAILCALET